MEKAEDRLGITCPKASKFYVCPGKPSRFLGCCSVNPCDTVDGSCPQESLEYTSFNASAYNDIPAQDCVKQEPGSAWYSCAATKPPFIGCCNSVNPCSALGCPADSLRAGALSGIKKNAAVFLGEPPASSSSSASTPTSSSTTSATSSATGVSKADANVQEHPGPSKAAIAGISVGVTIAVVILITIVIVWLRKRFEVKRKQQQQWHDPSVKNPGDPYPHDYSPNSQSMTSPGTSPATMNVSSYTGYQPSPPQQWNSYRPLATQYDAPHHHAAGAMTAELPAVVSNDTRKACDEKMGLKMGYGPAELGSDKETGQLRPVELEDPNSYDREPRQPGARG